MFAVKCLMKISPNKVLLSMLVVSVIGFAYILRIAERPASDYFIDHSDNSNSLNLSFYTNAIWCVLITICTSSFIKSYKSSENIDFSRLWRLFPSYNDRKNHHIYFRRLGNFLCFTCGCYIFEYAGDGKF